ncbi:hypothetical protein FNL39_11918 [Nocardia caishijiensis]|uniref:Uncharacterized protein n=1 Tax=Nocardia caishijiensis TaxID=184756 RepID=A0ABQ6YE79_9NOCA|nr:hypothetical protein FNL39_11918 [Nocardia caishijiensis]
MSSAIWPFPLPVNIFGTVAAWVIVILTVGGVSISGLAYLQNRKENKQKSQARHVRFTSLHWTDNSYHAKVHNLSDRSIYDLHPNQGRKWSLRSVVADECRSRGRQLSDEEIAALKEEWDATSGGTLYIWDYDSAHVGPGETREVEFRGTKKSTERYWISFRDSAGCKWTLELDGTEPESSDDPSGPEQYRWWLIFKNPFKYLSGKKSSRQQKIWLDRNVP